VDPAPAVDAPAADVPGAKPATGTDPAAAQARHAELLDRLAITVILGPAVLWMVEAGGLLYLAMIGLLLGVAAWEYARLFEARDQRPARVLLIAGVLLLVASAQFPVLNPHGLLLALLILAPLVWHLFDYERGAPRAGTDFVITLGGIFYLGWLGRYFVALRLLPDGTWWLLAALTSMWVADTGAYTFGRLFGRHKLAPRLSPKKTWEGYFGSALMGCLGGAVLSLFWGLGAGPDSRLTWQTGAVLGLLVGALGPLGDLGVSMLKRQMGVKDTGSLLAGHGGALDRIDSWLVAVTVGYYFALAVPYFFQ
jgi:phosphatidate cytidylyltransferase